MTLSITPTSFMNNLDKCFCQVVFQATLRIYLNKITVSITCQINYSITPQQMETTVHSDIIVGLKCSH